MKYVQRFIVEITTERPMSADRVEWLHGYLTDAAGSAVELDGQDNAHVDVTHHDTEQQS